MTLAFFVLIQYWSVTDGRTDIPPLAIPAVCIACYANALVKSYQYRSKNSRSQTDRYVQFPNCRPNPSAVVANCVHTDNANATQLDSCVASASAVCIGHKVANYKSSRLTAEGSETPNPVDCSAPSCTPNMAVVSHGASLRV